MRAVPEAFLFSMYLIGKNISYELLANWGSSLTLPLSMRSIKQFAKRGLLRLGYVLSGSRRPIWADSIPTSKPD